MTIYDEIKMDIDEMLKIQKWQSDYENSVISHNFEPSEDQKQEYAKHGRRLAELRRKYGF
uniref:Uncharacterized protein n=1 Tax=viral metagenome TaxID=1070528 RepID=A0A6M3J120_9ZZZZ